MFGQKKALTGSKTYSINSETGERMLEAYSEAFCNAKGQVVKRVFYHTDSPKPDETKVNHYNRQGKLSRELTYASTGELSGTTD